MLNVGQRYLLWMKFVNFTTQIHIGELLRSLVIWTDEVAKAGKFQLEQTLLLNLWNSTGDIIYYLLPGTPYTKCISIVEIKLLNNLFLRIWFLKSKMDFFKEVTTNNYNDNYDRQAYFYWMLTM